MLYVAIWYVWICPVVHSHDNTTYRDIPNCNIQHKNAPEDGLLKSKTCRATECYE